MCDLMTQKCIAGLSMWLIKPRREKYIVAPRKRVGLKQYGGMALMDADLREVLAKARFKLMLQRCRQRLRVGRARKVVWNVDVF